MNIVGIFNVAVVVLILVCAVAIAVWMGWRMSEANARQHGLVATSDRDVAINDEADMGEVR